MQGPSAAAPHGLWTMTMSTLTKIYLDESEMPTRWYNVVADLPEPPPPPLHPGTHQPATGDDFAALFPKALIEQEMSAERYIDIPGDVLDVYRLWRPSPLFRAHRLEKLLDTPRAFTTSTRVLAPRVLTNPIPRCRRFGTTRRKAFANSPPKPAQANGVVPWRSLAPSSVWSARSGR